MTEHGDRAYDVAIVGGGPAGLSASIWLARYLHRVVLVDSGDPRNWETRGVNGFLGHPAIKPAELRGQLVTYDFPNQLICISGDSAFHKLDRLATEVASKKRDPYSAVDELLTTNN